MRQDLNIDESEAESDDAEHLAQQDEDVIVVDPMKDCYELTKFTAEQEWLLHELYESLESGNDEEEQTQNMMAGLYVDDSTESERA